MLNEAFPTGVVHRGITPDNLVVSSPDILRERFMLWSWLSCFAAGRVKLEIDSEVSRG